MKILTSKDTLAINKALEYSQFEYNDINKKVEDIVNDVFMNKDEACFRLTKQFDQVSLDSFKVTKEEIKQAIKNTPKELYNDLVQAYNNIKDFHERQAVEEFFIEKRQSIIGQIIRPIEKVGMYVPGGTAAYPSTVLMNAVPAKIAGVERLVMITPPNKEGSVKDVLLVAASIAGVDEIYKIGGAQGIAALTFGTQSIPKVDKIVGPGNIYVAIAKKIVSGKVGIDMIAGPSEVVVVADEFANPKYIAADLLAQAEHDELAQAILLTPSPKIIKDVINEIKRQTELLSRKEIINKSLENTALFIQTSDLFDAIKLVNRIAPEHLELQVQDPDFLVPKIKNAGAIFIGEYTPEPVGDYFAGPNHTLPTSGTARFSSALNTNDFIKTISYIKYSKQSLYESKDSIIRIANEEGLTAHANAVKIRFDL